MSYDNDYNKDTFWTSFDEVKEKLRYYIKLNGVMVEVEKNVYHCMFNSYRKNLRLQKQNNDSGLVSIDADQNGHGLYSILSADTDVEKEVNDRLVAEYIYSAINCLDSKDKQIIIGIYYERKTEVALGIELGISRSTVQKRKQKILEKLRMAMDEIYHNFDD